jgi:hypothetical protein
MYFNIKNYLKNNHNHTAKHTLAALKRFGGVTAKQGLIKWSVHRTINGRHVYKWRAVTFLYLLKSFINV